MKWLGYDIMGAGVVGAYAIGFVYPDETTVRRLLDHPWLFVACLALVVLGGVVGYPYKKGGGA